MLFPGIGSTINIFDKVSKKLLQRLSGLNGKKIYGFVPAQCGDRILVFGSKQFTVISTSNCEQPSTETGKFYREFDPILCDDWLHSAVWVDEVVVALLTAHNVVQVRVYVLTYYTISDFLLSYIFLLCVFTSKVNNTYHVLTSFSTKSNFSHTFITCSNHYRSGTQSPRH